MAAFLKTGLELYKALDYGSEGDWRDKQAQWVDDDLSDRGAPLTPQQKKHVKRMLMKRTDPRVSTVDVKSTFKRLVDAHRVGIKINGDLEFTGVYCTDHLIARPMFGFGKQPSPMKHIRTNVRVSQFRKGYRASWVSVEDVTATDGLHRMQRYHSEEDVPGFIDPFTRERGKKRESKRSDLVFKTSFTHEPSTITPFWPSEGNGVPLQRSKYGKQLLVSARSGKDGRRERSKSTKR